MARVIGQSGGGGCNPSQLFCNIHSGIFDRTITEPDIDINAQIFANFCAIEVLLIL